MNWQESKSIPGGFTLWVALENHQKYWAVTEDRDNRGVFPRHDLNHPLTKRAAMEVWKLKREQEGAQNA